MDHAERQHSGGNNPLGHNGTHSRRELMEAPFFLTDLVGTEEAFMSSSTKEIVPIVRIDDTLVGGGKPGKETARLIERFNKYIADPALWEKRQKEHPYGSV